MWEMLGQHLPVPCLFFPRMRAVQMDVRRKSSPQTHNNESCHGRQLMLNPLRRLCRTALLWDPWLRRRLGVSRLERRTEDDQIPPPPTPRESAETGDRFPPLLFAPRDPFWFTAGSRPDFELFDAFEAQNLEARSPRFAGGLGG